VDAAIRALRAALGREEDLGKVFGRFMDLTEMLGFIELGALGIAPGLRAVLDMTAARLPGALDTQLSNLAPTWIAEHKLTHGSCLVGNRLAAFFFFEDLQGGMMAVHEGGGMMRFARLTLAAVPAGSCVCPRPAGIN
jgi:hypothetical protein